MSRILILDRELGFMWALAESLKTRGIETIPSTSVEEAEAILAALQPDLALLIARWNGRAFLPSSYAASISILR
jgi:DNA-binding response OmpR family regulator